MSMTRLIHAANGAVAAGFRHAANELDTNLYRSALGGCRAISNLMYTSLATRARNRARVLQLVLAVAEVVAMYSTTREPAVLADASECHTEGLVSVSIGREDFEGFVSRDIVLEPVHRETGTLEIQAFLRLQLHQVRFLVGRRLHLAGLIT